LLKLYNLKQDKDIVITRFGKNGIVEIYDFSSIKKEINVLNDSMPLLYNILPKCQGSDLKVVWNHGIIKFSTDLVQNKHKGHTCLVYSYISEDSLLQLWNGYSFFEETVPDVIDKWFYKIEDNWYILSPEEPNYSWFK